MESWDSLEDPFLESWCILENQYLGIPRKIPTRNPFWGSYRKTQNIQEEIRIWGLGGLEGHFHCKLQKGVGQKLCRVILLRFGPVAFWKTRTVILLWNFVFWDVSMSPQTY